MAQVRQIPFSQFGSKDLQLPPPTLKRRIEHWSLCDGPASRQSCRTDSSARSENTSSWFQIPRNQFFKAQVGEAVAPVVSARFQARSGRGSNCSSSLQSEGECCPQHRVVPVFLASAHIRSL